MGQEEEKNGRHNASLESCGQFMAHRYRQGPRASSSMVSLILFDDSQAFAQSLTFHDWARNLTSSNVGKKKKDAHLS